jgi:hypothetical protein
LFRSCGLIGLDVVLNKLTKALVALVFRVRFVLAAENVRTGEFSMNHSHHHGGGCSSSSIAGRWCCGEEQIVNASAAVLERGGSRLCVDVDPIRCSHGIVHVVVVVSECVMLNRDGFVSKHQFTDEGGRSLGSGYVSKTAIHDPRLENCDAQYVCTSERT